MEKFVKVLTPYGITEMQVNGLTPQKPTKFLDSGPIPEEYWDTLRQYTQYDYSFITEENENG